MIPAYRKPNEVSPMIASLAALRVSRPGHRERELHKGPTEVKADMVCREEHLQWERAQRESCRPTGPS